MFTFQDGLRTEYSQEEEEDGSGESRPVTIYSQTLISYGDSYKNGVCMSYYDEKEGNCYSYAYAGKGSVANLTGEMGESVVSYTYDIYGSVEAGNVEEGSGAGADVWNPYLYCGEYTDYRTGNQYLGVRYYHPATGCFPTRDAYKGDLTEQESLSKDCGAGGSAVMLNTAADAGSSLEGTVQFVNRNTNSFCNF